MTWPLLALLLFAGTAWAGSDMASSNYKIRRSEINSGGSSGASASHKLIDSIGTPGGGLLSGATYFVFTGYSNIVSHPDAIEDLSLVTGTSTGQLLMSWTAPTAYGSTGTASGYTVRYSTTAPVLTEPQFVFATLYANSWTPQAPGGLEVQTLSGLTSNTTYYFAVKGRDAAGNTGYLSNYTAAATLTDPVSGIQITNVYQSSVTVSWTGLGAGNALGYMVQASTTSNFSTTIRSSATANALQTSLTVSNLRRGRTYHFRVGGLNWTGAANFVVGPSTITLPGPAPANPAIFRVYASSISVSWSDVTPDVGYIAQASLTSAFAAISGSSVTTDVTRTSLSIQNLLGNTTYYLRAGSLYDEATSYAFTVPASTVTHADVPLAPVSGAFAMVGASSMTVTWLPGNNASGTQFRVELSSVSAVAAATSTAVTAALAHTFTGLMPDTTYWARVQALGIAGQDSAYLSIGSTITIILPPENPVLVSVEMTSITLRWDWAGPNVRYIMDVAPGDPFAAHLTSTTSQAIATVAGLSPDSVYMVRVQAQSRSSSRKSGWSVSYTTYTLASPPVSLSTTAVSANSISLIWDGNGNPQTALYYIERSTTGVAFAQVDAVRAVTYTDIRLSPGTFYSYRVRAVNENAVPTAYSNTITLRTAGTPSAPMEPAGFWAEREQLSSNQWRVTYRWTPVTKRTDGSTLDNLAGYELYTSASLLTPRSQWVRMRVLPEETYSETTDGTILYYCWRAVDSSGMRSAWSVIMDDGADLNHIYMAEDNITRLVIPEVAAGGLRAARNTYGANLRVDWTERSSEETGRVVRSMHAQFINIETAQEITDLVIAPPVMRGVIAYSVENGKVVAGAPEPYGSSSDADASRPRATTRAPILDASQADRQLSLFWFNGVEWVKTTGTVSVADNTLSFTGSRAGRYQIRAASHSAGAVLTRVYPRIITPNGDGWNDKAIFQFDNPQLLPLSGKLYDIAGAFVANLAAGPNPDSSLAWDGKDSGGAVVPGGIYLYQIDIGGTPETGTVVVAR